MIRSYSPLILLACCGGTQAVDRTQIAIENAAYGAELEVCIQQARTHTKTKAEYDECAASVDKKHALKAPVTDGGKE